MGVHLDCETLDDVIGAPDLQDARRVGLEHGFLGALGIAGEQHRRLNATDNDAGVFNAEA